MHLGVGASGPLQDVQRPVDFRGCSVSDDEELVRFERALVLEDAVLRNDDTLQRGADGTESTHHVLFRVIVLAQDRSL